MTYLEHVTTYWLGLVGRGGALSSADLALVRDWEAAGLGPDAVCRALRRAAESRRGRRLTLADCAGYVERLAPPRERGEGASDAGGAVAWTRTGLLEGLEAVGRDTEEGELRDCYRAVYRLVQAMPEGALDATALARLDDLAVRELERRLPSARRTRLRAESRREARSLLGREARREAVEALARSLLETECCETFGLVLPSALLSRGEEP